MPEYTADDGLSVLTYLGITNVTDKEKEVFRAKWDQVYQSHGRDLIKAIWVLYSEVLPFTCGDGDRGSFVVSTFRDSDFGNRLDVTGLEKDLKEDIPLKTIIIKGPHEFYRSS